MGESQVQSLSRPPFNDMLTRGHRWLALKAGVIFDDVTYKETSDGASVLCHGGLVPWGDVAKNPDAGDLVVGKTLWKLRPLDPELHTPDVFVLAELEWYFKPDRENSDEELNGLGAHSVRALFLDLLSMEERRARKLESIETLRRVRKFMDEAEGEDR